MESARTTQTEAPSRPAPAPLDWRRQFDCAGGGADVLWVMHCAEGPVPRASAQAVCDFLEVETRPWLLDWEGDFLGRPAEVRRQAARLFGGEAEAYTLVPTTSAGLALIAQGLDWRPGDDLVVPLGEFPSNAWPWRTLQARGVEVREVELWDGHRAGREAWRSVPPPADVDPEVRLLEALGPSTRVLSVSWVRFQDGLRLDLLRLAAGCAERGVLLVVDGIQGAGTLPLELGSEALAGVAAFATGGHKGLLAPQGLGVLWTAADLRQHLTPPGGWLSVEGATDFSRPSTDFDRGWLAGGERLELGVPNLVGCAALAPSLQLLADADPTRIAEHVSTLQGALLQALAGSPWQAEAERLDALRRRDRLGSILSFHHGARGEPALQDLLQRGFDQRLYASVREGYLRIALHGWHLGSDISRLVEWLVDTPT